MSNLIQTLNRLLVGELTASNRCLAHAELCDENGYLRLFEAHERRAQEEMAHARALIRRLISLRARPVPTRQEPIGVDVAVDEQIRGDLRALQETVAGYHQGIRLASEAGDQGTLEMLETILREEQRQLDWLQLQAAQLDKHGLQAYLRDHA
jgi:bacterioferritin